MDIHFFNLKITQNVQPFLEYNIFVATSYIIILFHMINLKTLRHMEDHFTNFTLTSAGALDFLV